MRALKILVVVMGVMIVAGIIVVVVTIAGRMGAGVRQGGPVDVVLHEPEGARIAGIAALRDELAVQVQGGGPDRVVLVDPRSGAVIGRVVLGR
ncbi:MAG TPA: DUF6476 family protein [Acetobacteraceae bacterium]|nr:DUF6476 family protein [Acetobacteraceae bacterium]